MILNFHYETFRRSLQKLPDDIIYECILPYTYELQSPELCEDIQDFYYTKNILFDLYYTRYPYDMADQYNWLSNDITRFLNDDQGTMYDIVPFFCQAVSRQYLMRFKSKMDIQRLIQIRELSNLPKISRDIWMKLAILLPAERTKLIHFIHQETA